MKNLCSKCNKEIDKFGRALPIKDEKGHLIPYIASYLLLIKEIECVDKFNDRKRQLKVMLLDSEEEKNKKQIPGKLILNLESVEDCLSKYLQNKAGLSKYIFDKKLDLFNVYGEPKDNKKKHVVSLVYTYVMSNQSLNNIENDLMFYDIYDIIENYKDDNFIDNHYSIIKEYAFSKLNML